MTRTQGNPGRGSDQGSLSVVVAVLATLLILAIALILWLLMNEDTAVNPTATPSATPTPTAASSATPTPESTPTASPEPDPEPVAEFLDVVAPPTIACITEDTVSPVPVSWQTTGANHGWYGIDTLDAEANPTDMIPLPNGTGTFNFDCSSQSHTYTLSILGTDGIVVHHSFQVARVWMT